MSSATRLDEHVARLEFDIWSTTATLLVTDPGVMDTAAARFTDVLDRVDAACSRFRADSEINRILADPGRPGPLSPVLNAVVERSLRVATATGYLVDPTVAAAVIAAGYDRDFAEVIGGMTGSARPGVAEWGGRAPGAWQLRHDPPAAVLTVPPGIGIDLGATAKAFAADEAARLIVDAVGLGGVLVGIGGDIAVAGDPPAGGWRIAVADDHRSPTAAFQTVSISSGGLATSSTTVRRWPTSTGWRHHIIDPRTGRNPDSRWRTVSVAAASCVDANAAATAAIVLGDRARGWLAGQGLPALLIDVDGTATTVADWPEPAVTD